MPDTHTCPGCQAPNVPHHQFACRVCWWRLPADLRRAINTAYKTSRSNPGPHRAAMLDAADWYRDHPPATP